MCRLNNGAWMRPTGFRPHTRAHVEERERESRAGLNPDRMRMRGGEQAMREKGKDSSGHLSFRAGLTGARAGEPPAGFA